MKPVFSELSAEWAMQLERQRATVREAAAQLGFSPWPNSTAGRAQALQAIIDDGYFSPEQAFELQALGVVFGDILCDEAEFCWVEVTDEFGHDPTLRWRDSTLNVNALTMIAKRVERGERPLVDEMLDWAIRFAEKESGERQ